MRLAALALAMLARPALAQDLGGDIVELLRGRDCAMEVAAVAEVFSVMGRVPQEIEEAVDRLLASGSANLLGGTLALSPSLCEPEPARDRVAPLPWLEERLAAAPGCWMALPELAAEAGLIGVPQQAFDRAVGDLSALGRVAEEDGGLRLRLDLCAPGMPRDWQLDRVLLLGEESVRAMLGLLALERGCRLDLGDSGALLQDLMAEAAERFFLNPTLSDAAVEALRLRIGEALDDPGPAYRREGDVLVARYCLP
jgi:hypothetical protein